MIEISEKMLESLSNQLSDSLKAMGKAKTVEDKLAYSQIVKNLSESMKVFLTHMMDSDMMDYDYDYEDE